MSHAKDSDRRRQWQEGVYRRVLEVKVVQQQKTKT